MRQPSGSRELRFNEMIRAQLDEIDPAAQGFQAAKVCLDGFGGEDEADLCGGAESAGYRGAESAGYRGAQKSLLYT
jgi:hypothetical protein